MNGPKMYEYAKQLTIFFDAYLKIGQQYVKRCADAQKGFSAQIQECLPKEKSLKPPSPHELWQSWNAYWKDSVQRSILFWDTLRQRGNNWIDHEKAGKPPVLFFDYEIIMDGRSLERPVNYALLRIIPPRGSVINNSKRPFVIIDPRAGVNDRLKVYQFCRSKSVPPPARQSSQGGAVETVSPPCLG